MARAKECDHTDAYIICPVCDPVEAHTSRQDEEPPGAAIQAAFPGTCDICGDPIRVGDWIVVDPDDEDRVPWAHGGCVYGTNGEL